VRKSDVKCEIKNQLLDQALCQDWVYSMDQVLFWLISLFVFQLNQIHQLIIFSFQVRCHVHQLLFHVNVVLLYETAIEIVHFLKRIQYWARIVENSLTRFISSILFASKTRRTWKFPSPTCPTIGLQEIYIVRTNICTYIPQQL